MKRTDEHRPSAINPEDYEFVAFEHVKFADFGDCEFILAERDKIREHMAQTGGTYSTHEHGGNCMVCGNVMAIYTILFYHAKTNTYVRTGSDCAEKIEMGYSRDGFSRFVSAAKDALLARAGKRKAEAVLASKGLEGAWALYAMPYDDLPKDMTRPYHDCESGEVAGYHPFSEELKVLDIVRRLVKYGSASDKALDYVGSLLKRIEERPAKLAKWAAEKEAAAEVPDGKRVTVNGKVLKVEERDGFTRYSGSVWKMTVKDKSGFVVWGTVPSGMSIPKAGDEVEFTATLEASERDPKFGFFKRPKAGHPETREAA